MLLQYCNNLSGHANEAYCCCYCNIMTQDQHSNAGSYMHSKSDHFALRICRLTTIIIVILIEDTNVTKSGLQKGPRIKKNLT